MLKRFIKNYHFVADYKTGVTIRWGKSLNDNPIFAPVPELADISISNHCTKGCSFCYRDSRNNNEFMSVEDYCNVLDYMNHEKYGNVFQVALGGGEPLEHPDFLAIIDETIRRDIVPNFTTNGIHIDHDICKRIKGKVGAVAISVTSIHDIPVDKVKLLNLYGIRVNLHYLLSSKTINEAINILRGDNTELFDDINAIIFLTYKPAGRASRKFVIKSGSTLDTFIREVESRESQKPKIGFDACFVPLLMRNTNIPRSLVDTCEGGFFSVYVDHKSNVSPCSFSAGRDSYSLHEYDFYDIWLNKFEQYRETCKNHCRVKKCSAYDMCRGCCPYYPEITACYE
ncbi:MAG: radical SAM protein [Bacteroidales bacterium]|nr:radical SAM protein [Bacteroidales bacterium]